MMLKHYLLIAIGGALGAVSRFATVSLTQCLLISRFPVGTLLVNCLGAFIIGFFMSFFMGRLGNAEYWRMLIVVGFLGSYTTFSSFTWETWALIGNGQWLSGISNIILTNLFTILLTLMGIQLGRWI